MRIYFNLPFILLVSLSVEAADDLSKRSGEAESYQECVGVSLFTVQGRELNSMVKSGRQIDNTNIIPKGWNVVDVTTKTEAGRAEPYLVICH